MKLLATVALVVSLAQVCTPKTVHDPAGPSVASTPADPQSTSPPASAPPAPTQPPESWPGALPPTDQPTPRSFEPPPPAHRDRPDPQPTTATGIEAEYSEIQAELARLSRELNERNKEVVQRFGRNDTPEALAVLTPIRNQLANARQREQHLLCRDTPQVRNPKKLFESMGIRMQRFRVDSRFVDAYITAKVKDGALSRGDAQRLRFIIAKSGQGVMNPSSLGASTINQRIAQALRCFGLKGPPRSGVVRPPEPPPDPPPPPLPKLRYFRTCGDAVCQAQGYRGPFSGVPRCAGQREGAACSVRGEQCDLVNDCNMFLVCSDTNPSTRCPR